ncbi:Os09g0455600 [Oryza sativa Japonica Group]|uniref:Os09g0455600 protein n=1 Tax=Oryza sativa subsp. japonica TaxID=39947 RepID=A0A0P0XMN8_ORYSJ|nr:Os09g0455600 [Oryza sativa Japonica Group]
MRRGRRRTWLLMTSSRRGWWRTRPPAMSSGVDSGGCGHRRRAVAWCGTWMVEDAVAGDELQRGVGVWTAEDAAAGDKLRRGAWAVEDVATGNELWRSVRRGQRRALQVGDKVPARRGPSIAKEVATSDELWRGVWTAENAAASDDLRRGRRRKRAPPQTYLCPAPDTKHHDSSHDTQCLDDHILTKHDSEDVSREAEESTDGEVPLEGSEELSAEARDYEEVSPGCSRRWKEARNRAIPRRIRHDLEKPTDGARAGGRKRGIGKPAFGERWSSFSFLSAGFATMRASGG